MSVNFARFTAWNTLRRPTLDPREALENFFQTPWLFYFERELNELAAILEANGMVEWSRVPKLYFILRGLGCQHLISVFVVNGVSDKSIPLKGPLLLAKPIGITEEIVPKFEQLQARIVPQPQSTYEDHLQAYFDPKRDLDKDPLDDVDFQQIGRLLEFCGKPEEASAPKLYYVLYSIGHLDALPKFLSRDYNDMWFPFPGYILRAPLLHGRAAKEAFLRVQEDVCSKQWSEDVHLNLLSDDHGLLRVEKTLGSGGTGEVSHVYCRSYRKHYAQKLVHRREGLRYFANEVKMLKSVNHRHCVSLVCSYTDPDYLAILSQPVADMNLGTLLEARSIPLDRKQLLYTFFGCLSTALSYLHGKGIRHKDIKPQNILIHSNNVLFTDFGLSADALSETTSMIGNTPRYNSPEFDDGESRDESSDVWSLGCVFFEILAALQGLSISDIKLYFRGKGTHREAFNANPDAVRTWLAHECSEATLAGFSKMAVIAKALTLDMLSTKASRPDSHTLVQRIGEGVDIGSVMYGSCCREELRRAAQGMTAGSADNIPFLGSGENFTEEPHDETSPPPEQDPVSQRQDGTEGEDDGITITPAILESPGVPPESQPQQARDDPSEVAHEEDENKAVDLSLTTLQDSGKEEESSGTLSQPEPDKSKTDVEHASEDDSRESHELISHPSPNFHFYTVNQDFPKFGAIGNGTSHHNRHLEVSKGSRVTVIQPPSDFDNDNSTLEAQLRLCRDSKGRIGWIPLECLDPQQVDSTTEELPKLLTSSDTMSTNAKHDICSTMPKTTYRSRSDTPTPATNQAVESTIRTPGEILNPRKERDAETSAEPLKQATTTEVDKDESPVHVNVRMHSDGRHVTVRRLTQTEIDNLKSPVEGQDSGEVISKPTTLLERVSMQQEQQQNEVARRIEEELTQPPEKLADSPDLWESVRATWSELTRSRFPVRESYQSGAERGVQPVVASEDEKEKRSQREVNDKSFWPLISAINIPKSLDTVEDAVTHTPPDMQSIKTRDAENKDSSQVDESPPLPLESTSTTAVGNDNTATDFSDLEYLGQKISDDTPSAAPGQQDIAVGENEIAPDLGQSSRDSQDLSGSVLSKHKRIPHKPKDLSVSKVRLRQGELPKVTNKAMRDYKASDEDELSFPAEALITDVVWINAFWSWGCWEGDSGLFPNEYVVASGAHVPWEYAYGSSVDDDSDQSTASNLPRGQEKSTRDMISLKIQLELIEEAELGHQVAVAQILDEAPAELWKTSWTKAMRHSRSTKRTDLDYEPEVRLLLSIRGIRAPEFRSDARKTAYIVAKRYKHEGVMQALLKHGGKSIEATEDDPESDTDDDDDGVSVFSDSDGDASDDTFTSLDQQLIKSVQMGNVDETEALLAAGANIEARDDEGRTALIWAALNGHVKVVNLLGSKGADVNAGMYAWTGSNGQKTINQGWTALHAAAWNGHVTIVANLLAREAIIKTAVSTATTPLHEAARRGHLPVVRTLVEVGADFNATTVGGLTVLDLACLHGHSAVASCLIQKQATSTREYDPVRPSLSPRSSLVPTGPSLATQTSTAAARAAFQRRERGLRPSLVAPDPKARSKDDITPAPGKKASATPSKVSKQRISSRVTEAVARYEDSANLLPRSELDPDPNNERRAQRRYGMVDVRAATTSQMPSPMLSPTGTSPGRVIPRQERSSRIKKFFTGKAWNS